MRDAESLDSFFLDWTAKITDYNTYKDRYKLINLAFLHSTLEHTQNQIAI